MRHYPDIPPDPKKVNLVKKPKARVDLAVLRRVGGFESDEITHAALVILGLGPGLSEERCGMPLDEAYERDRDLLSYSSIICTMNVCSLKRLKQSDGHCPTRFRRLRTVENGLPQWT